MTQEDKELLLLTDLCARLRYRVIVRTEIGHKYQNDELIDIGFGQSTGEIFVNGYPIKKSKPYLRTMSSMTEEECITLSKLIPYETDAWKYIKTPIPLYVANIEQFDFFHRHHLDWRGLILKGLALEAPEGLYETK